MQHSIGTPSHGRIQGALSGECLKMLLQATVRIDNTNRVVCVNAYLAPRASQRTFLAWSHAAITAFPSTGVQMWKPLCPAASVLVE